MANTISSTSECLTGYDYQNILINVSRFCGYLPQVSRVTGLITIFQKCLILPLLKPETIANNRYFTYIQNQPYLRLAVQLDSFGFILVCIYDLYNSVNSVNNQNILETVKKNGLELKNFADIHKNNKKIVLAAIENNFQAAQFVGTNLKSNKQFWLEAAEVNPNVLEFLPHTLACDEDLIPKKIDVAQLTPQRIREYIDLKVTGQKTAKTALSVAIFRHFQRINSETPQQFPYKSNVILYGPSGSGKTLLVETVAKLFKVPFVVGDATKYSPTGYIGGSVEDLLTTLYVKSNYNLELAEKGIIFIDEIDKLKRSKEDNNQNGYKTTNIQQSLLKIVEGTKIEISTPSSVIKFMPFAGKKVEIDTKNILFIVGGAFVDLEKEVFKRLQKNNLNSTLITSDELLSKADQRDFISFGMMSEFIGRFSYLAHVKQLKANEMIAILMRKDSIINYYIKMFKNKNIDLRFSNAVLHCIAFKANISLTGARGLQGIVDALMTNIINKFLSDPNIERIILTKETVFRGSDPTIVYQSK